jgi:hypothetical protein
MIEEEADMPSLPSPGRGAPRIDLTSVFGADARPGPTANPPRADPRPSAGPAPPSLPSAAPGIGLFRAARAPVLSGMDTVRPPTAKELLTISAPGLLVIFDPRRLAEITRPRTPQDDVKAAQFLKAQKTLESQGWAAMAHNMEHHSIFFGCQVVFQTGMSPATLAMLFQWAVPFGLDTPCDVSKDPAWWALLDSDASLFPQLEAEVHGCRFAGREFSMPASLFSKIRALAEAYFLLRAESLRSLLDLLGTTELEEQAKSAVRGYIDQARTLPVAWGHIESMIDLGVLRQHGTDPAVAENAARVAMTRAFLTALLQGQAPSWGMADLVQSHVLHQPSASLLHSTDLARLSRTSPAAAALAASLPGLAVTPVPNGHTPTPLPAVANPGTAGPPVPAAEAQLGFRLGPHGTRSHPAYFSGEYAVPPGWLPPPPALPLGASAGPAQPGNRQNRTSLSSALSVPTARSLVGRLSPFATPSPHPCDYCGVCGHAQYECPRRFAESFHLPLPGFTAQGSYDAACWTGGDLTPIARAAMANYLDEFKILPHRKFGVTADHIRHGTAPAVKP